MRWLKGGSWKKWKSMLADGSHGRVGSGADVVVHQLPSPLTQVILYVQLPDQLSNHVVLESTKKRKRRRRKKVDLSVSANFAGGTLCCPFWPKRFMAFWPPPDVLPAEMAHGTKWGNLQERDLCMRRERVFFERVKVPVAGVAQRGLTLRESVASDMILSQPLKVAT